MQWTVIHTATRVIRCITSDPAYVVAGDETKIDTTVANLDLAGGPWKLAVDNISKVAPNQTEIDLSGVDEDRNAFLIGQKLTTMHGKIDAIVANGMADSVSLGGLSILTNVGAAYDAIQAAKGLGVALVEFAGVVSVRFDVFVSKVGTGVQSWQLFNVTDNSELARIDDSGAAGDKVLSVTRTNPALPAAPILPTSGTKLLRVRAKSTVAADDPVYYGATLKVTRNLLTDYFAAMQALRQ